MGRGLLVGFFQLAFAMSKAPNSINLRNSALSTMKSVENLIPKDLKLDTVLMGARAPISPKHFSNKSRTPTRGFVCIQNFEDHVCPEHFHDIKGTCVTTDVVTEQCATNINNARSSALARMALANTDCKIKYPCFASFDELKPRRALKCPAQWEVTNEENFDCSPTAEYQGPCRGPMSFLLWNSWQHYVWSSSLSVFMSRQPPAPHYDKRVEYMIEENGRLGLSARDGGYNALERWLFGKQPAGGIHTMREWLIWCPPIILILVLLTQEAGKHRKKRL